MKMSIIVATLMAVLASAAPALAKVKGEQVSYAAGGVEMKGYLAYDEAKKGKRPAVLVVHEWWGHNDYARTRARMLAKLGYVALAVDMYGGGKQAAHPGDAKKFMMEVFSKAGVAKERFLAARETLVANPRVDGTKVAAIGYCFGGAVVLNMARAGVDLAGVASLHGNLATQTPAKPGAIKAELLVAHGAADPFVTPEQLAAFKDEMKKAGAKMKFVAYKGAKHAFTNPAATKMGKKFKLPLAYNKSADHKSWRELVRFLKGVFK